MSASEALWQASPERIKASGLTAFINWVNKEYKLNLSDYDALWQWSVDELETFWAAVWRYYDIAPGQSYQQVLDTKSMPGARWFEGARLNFADYLLRQGDRGDLTRPAVIAESESREPVSVNWIELREQVVAVASHLRAAGVKPGDRVVAFLPISVEAVVAMLATTAVGAVWSSCSPDFGAKSVLERFAQIDPKVMFAVSSYRYNGKAFDRSEELAAIIEALPSLGEVITVPWLDNKVPEAPCKVSTWAEVLATTASYETFNFEAMPFEAPLWIMYSSGTTGAPKGIVHSQGGILVEFVKYAWLHEDIKPETVKFYFTTTGWAMFNILLGGMMAGCTMVVYDGCPTFPDNSRLWALCDRYKINYFGVNPSYVNSLAQAGYSPKADFDLASVDAVALTGSPSVPETFDWFYQNVHTDLHVMSISGGTDICGTFIAGSVDKPVYGGEIQVPCLGVDVCVLDDDGKELPAGEDGELVIRQPMPSMPIYFWGDPEGARYHDAYFNHFPGQWRHGDLVRRTGHGGYVISGRSDSTLNRYGVRMGTAEIYRALDSIADIKDSLVVSLELSGARFFMPLFIVLEEGAVLDDELLASIKSNLSQQCSPRHVPDEVYVIDEVPYTRTGKKLEVPVKKLLMGVAVDKALNKGAVANIAAMDFFISLADDLIASDYS